MKKTAKFFTLLLALTMALAVCLPAFATGDETPTGGSITIETRAVGNTYSIYKVFDLESYSGDAYSYKIATPFTQEMIEGIKTDGTGASSYCIVNTHGYVEWNLSDKSETKVQEFAEKLLAKIKENNAGESKTQITSTYSHTIGNTVTDTTHIVCTPGDPDTASGMTKYTLKFQALDLGYYLIDSTVGTYAILTNAAPDATVAAKNTIPVVTKSVSIRNNDGSVTGNWSSTNTAKIGDDVVFGVSIDVGSGAQDYTLYDTMDESLTFAGTNDYFYVKIATSSNNGQNAIAVENGKDIVEYDTSGVPVEKTYATYTEGTQWYTVTAGTETDNYTFKVTFNNAVLEAAHAAANDKTNLIYVYYKATLNEKAVVGKQNIYDTTDTTKIIKTNDGNTNEAYLTYGEVPTQTAASVTETYTYSVDLVKTDSAKKVLSGAEFNICITNTTNLIQFVKSTDATTGAVSYRVATAAEIADTNRTDITTTINIGTAKIIGLANGDYSLKETKAPDGYNMLSNDQKFTVTDQNNDATLSDDKTTYTSGGVQIINKTGSILPETGGIGTTLFIVFGGIVVLGTGVLLVTKRRMRLMDSDE